MTGSLCNWFKTAMARRRRSPVSVLDRRVDQSPAGIAPERAADLQQLLDQHKLIFDYNDDEKGIRVGLTSHHIFMPVADRENVWAQSLRFWVVMQEYAKAQHSGATEFDLHGNERLRRAAEVVAWTLENLKSKIKEVWPRTYIRPTAKPQDTDRQVANELYLGAMGFIILHEVAHVVKGHEGSEGPLSQKEEKEADLFATEWILDGVDPKNPAFQKRLLCIAAALLCLQGFETGGAPRWKGSHPPAHERIYNCLDKYRAVIPEKVVAFLVVCLQALFAKSSVTPDIDGKSFDDILDGLFFSITRR